VRLYDFAQQAKINILGLQGRNFVFRLFVTINILNRTHLVINREIENLHQVDTSQIDKTKRKRIV